MLNNKEQQEYDRILNNASKMPGYFTTTTSKVAKELLLIPFYFCRGEGRKFKVKSRGLGVYEVSSKIY